MANKIGFDKKNQKQFFSKVKGSLMYYLPRDLLRHIAKVLDTMDFVGYTKFEIRKIYEQDARNYMSKILKDKDFIHIEPEPKEIGGYEIDILATQGTKRAGYIPKAFGEVTMIKRSGAKGKAEKFSNWLLRMRGREYKPEDGDIAFFVCPPGSVTKGTQDILKANDIKLYKFDSANVEELLKQKAKKEPKGEIETEVVPPRIQEEEEEIVIIKQSKYNLQDVPGIGPTYAKKLKDAGIHTVKDLLECNAKMKVKEIYGVGETRINNWKQNARQILDE
ncbi:MAG: helix-hairpin-helix domain-containing protein [Candidatus Lokiarchaeota archaeon]